MHDLATQVAGNVFRYLHSMAKRCLGRLVHVSMGFNAFCVTPILNVSRKFSMCINLVLDTLKFTT